MLRTVVVLLMEELKVGPCRADPAVSTCAEMGREGSHEPRHAGVRGL